MLRVIREVKPQWVVGENVLGIVNWDGGVVFDQVQADLEAEGYEVQPYVLPAAGVGAPHRRDRVWFVAYANDNRYSPRRKGKGIEGHGCGNNGITKEWRQQTEWTNRLHGFLRSTPHPTGNGLHDQPTDGDYGIGTDNIESGTQRFSTTEGLGNERTAADTSSVRFQTKMGDGKLERGFRSSISNEQNKWDSFPTQSPVCHGDDELSSSLVRHINPEIYGTIRKRYTDKDLQEVWEAFQQEDILREIGRLYKIHEPGILFQVMQLCSPTYSYTDRISAYSEKASEKLMRKLREYGTLANTPQGRKLEEQFIGQFGDSLPILSHEIALVTMEVTRASRAFIAWHRSESIKAGGNAVLSALVYEIFKTINLYEQISINR